MPSLQIRDLPEHIYQKLLAEAKKQNRSLARQAIITLSNGLSTVEDPKARRRELISRIRSRPSALAGGGFSDATDIVREDRDHR